MEVVFHGAPADEELRGDFEGANLAVYGHPTSTAPMGGPTDLTVIMLAEQIFQRAFAR